MPLRVLSAVPEGLLDCEATDLHSQLGGPTLIRLAGDRSPAVFVSVLLHGNETSGWDGLRRYLGARRVPARDLVIFIGNTRAAAAGQRLLPGESDFNRIWRDAAGAGGALAAAVEAAIAGERLFASVDLHNNTGHNPYYSVVTDLDPGNLGLAYLFSDKVVYVEEPDTVLTRIFAGRCPAVALEAGPVGDPRCADRVEAFLERCLSLDVAPRPPADPAALSLFQTRARVHVRDGIPFSFAGDGDAAPTPLLLTGGVEAVNFHELPPGTVFATSTLPPGAALQVLDAAHRDVTDAYLESDGRYLLLRQSVVPAMYTTDPVVILQDCLCYFMDRLTP